jgi:carbonic anhydrase
MEPIKFKVAVFEYITKSMRGYRFAASHDIPSPDQIRISEWVELEFMPISENKEMKNLAKVLDNTMRDIQNEADIKIAQLKKRKNRIESLLGE